MKSWKYILFSVLTALLVASVLTACEKDENKGEGNNGNNSGGFVPDLTSGLMLHLSFDDGSLADKSGNGHHGVANGDVEFITDTPTGNGKAIMIDGLHGQYVNIPYSLFNEKECLTISLWAKDFGTGPLFSTLNNGLGSPSLLMSPDGTDVKLRLLRYYDYQEDMSVSLNKYMSAGWHHIAVTAYKHEEAVLYIDGTRIDSTPIDYLSGVGNKTQLGGNADGHLNAWADPMKIDNVRAYSRVLSDADVHALYLLEGGVSGSVGKASTTRGLLAYYTLDDNTADNVYLKGNNGTLKGEGDIAFISKTPNGKGKAISLQEKQYVEVPTNLLKGKQAFTICLWAKDFGPGPLFSTLKDGLCSPSLLLRSEETDVKLCLLRYYDYQEDMSVALSSYQSSGWHHIAVTAFTDDEAVLYIDGTRIDSTPIGFLQGLGNKMQIGGNADGHLDAWADPMKVDNVRIHSVALTEAEVKAIYDLERN